MRGPKVIMVKSKLDGIEEDISFSSQRRLGYVQRIVVIVVPTLCKIAHDYPERDITELVETTIHDVYIIRDSAQGTDFDTLIIQAEGYAASGQTTYLKIYEGANLLVTISWTETSLTCKSGSYDISGWADGKHQLTAKVYVSGGTGCLQMIEYWVKK